MKPSKSSLDRLPKLVSERWEHDREGFERVLRDGLEIPEGAKFIAISLDGGSLRLTVATARPKLEPRLRTKAE